LKNALRGESFSTRNHLMLLEMILQQWTPCQEKEKMNTNITLDTTIEDLVELYPDAVSFLMEYGIRCLICGEPAWGTLGEAMREKNFPREKMEEVLTALRRNLVHPTQK